MTAADSDDGTVADAEAPDLDRRADLGEEPCELWRFGSLAAVLAGAQFDVQVSVIPAVVRWQPSASCSSRILRVSFRDLGDELGQHVDVAARAAAFSDQLPRRPLQRRVGRFAAHVPVHVAPVDDQRVEVVRRCFELLGHRGGRNVFQERDEVGVGCRQRERFDAERLLQLIRTPNECGDLEAEFRFERVLDRAFDLRSLAGPIEDQIAAVDVGPRVPEAERDE